MKRLTHLYLPKIALIFLYSYLSPVYAIPPPETLAFIGGSLLYPGLLIIGIVGVLFQYVWIKTRLYLLWRLYLPRIFFIVLLSLFLINSPTLLQWINNAPVSMQTIKHWQEIKSNFVFVDLRDPVSYQKIHVAGSLNFPSGSGLSDYLKNNPDKKIILYCDRGLKSASLLWLDTDPALLQQTKNENRLFYFPGGIYQLLRLEGHSAVPVVINIPSDYARYVLKDASFKRMSEFTDDKNPVLSNEALKEYQQLLSQHKIPLINTQKFQDELALQLFDQSKVNSSYFTTLMQVQPYPLKNLLLVCLILLMVLFFIRYKELLQNMLAKSSVWYQWSNILISLLMTIPVIIFSFQWSIPFNVYLYKRVPELPLNTTYVLSIYTLFLLALGVHLLYPKSNRLKMLHLRLSSVFAPTENIYPRPEWSWKNLIILGTALYLMCSILTIELSTILITSIFLTIPLFTDLLLYLFIGSLKNNDIYALNLLKKYKYTCDPQGLPFVQIDTQSEYSLGSIKLTCRNDTSHIGLFTGAVINNSNKLNQSESSLDNNHLNKASRIHYTNMVRDLLSLFQQDIHLILNREGHIVSLKLQHNQLDSRVINRHIILKHYQILPGSTKEQRFTSLALHDVFANPTPLMLDVLKNRWNKKGGCLRALHKLGLLVKYNDKTQEQFMVFSNQIYIDKTFEQSLFSSNKLLTWIRNKVVRLKFRLAKESILQDYYTLMLPGIQIRMMKLSDSLLKFLSEKKLHRIINRAIDVLCKESAMWQFYSSLLHQDAFRELQAKASEASMALPALLHDADDSLKSLPLPSYYELLSQPGLSTQESSSEGQSAYSYYRDAFLNTEKVRTHLRQFQLKEWQLISLLLAKLETQRNTLISLAYLTRDELLALPKEEHKLKTLLESRYNRWQLQNQYQFPPSFSLQEIEHLPLNTSEQKEDVAGNQPMAIRVAGKQDVITGIAVLFEANMQLESLAKHSILIADNLMPEQIVNCQHIKGIILKRGGYLSHSAIIAREKNIPMIAQFQISNIKNKDKLMIHSVNQVRILSNTSMKWSFLEEAQGNKTLGNKAYRLAIMSQQGFNIPESIILKHHTIEKIYELASSPNEMNLWQKYYQELKQLFDLMLLKKSSVMVRSSTNIEDSSHFSYAGMFYSQADINSVDEFISAICTSWHKMLESRQLIKEYSGENGVLLNLIVQPYIKGLAGGVLFTESETPNRMRIEIAAGGVAGVTEGNASLTSLNIDEKGHISHAIGEKNILSNQEYRDLYHLGKQLEILFGKPQDIEWIIADQKIYVIQCRDISDMANLISCP